MATWPTTPYGLPPGAVWNNGGIVSIVPGAAPDPNAAPMMFGAITPDELLLTGAGNLPWRDPGVANQMYASGNTISISTGRPVLGLSSDGGLVVLTNPAA